MFKPFFSISVLFSACLTAQAQSAHDLLRKGDEAYDFENYEEAEKRYRDAADLKYGDPAAVYNLGNALYQQGQWEDAATRFEQVANSAAEPAFKADALHNFGNTQMKLNNFEKAVKAYENSLRLRPGDTETKRNLQMAKKKLREEQQKEQQNQQQKQQEQQQQDSQNQQNNQQQNQGQGQPEQPSQPQQKPQEQPLEKLKKEESERLLETAIGPEDQKNARKYREQRQQPKSSGKEKDW